MKLAFHRQKDLADIRGMLWVQRGQLDLDYLRLWSGKMLEDAIQHELDERPDVVETWSNEEAARSALLPH